MRWSCPLFHHMWIAPQHNRASKRQQETKLSQTACRNTFYSLTLHRAMELQSRIFCEKSRLTRHHLSVRFATRRAGQSRFSTMSIRLTLSRTMTLRSKLASNCA